MAKILEFKGKIPRWVFEEFVIYLLEGEWIIRAKSGFTKEELLTAEKYANCRKNASEFGRLSKACKGLRMALEGILPKNNNLGIVNSLTKHMRSLLAYDKKHVRGERKLATALEHSEGLRMFTGYNFNPDATLQVRTNVVDGRLAVSNVKKPEGVSWVGFRVHVMDYDWELFTGEMHSGDWHFERDVSDGMLLELPVIVGGGDLVYLLEVQGFEERDGAFVGVGVDEKGVFVVDYLGGLSGLPCLPAKLHFGEARGCRGVSRGLETTRNDGKGGEARGCRGVSRGLETTRNDGKGVGERGYHSVSRGIETTRNDGKGGEMRGWCGVYLSRSVGIETTRNDGVKNQECLIGLPAKLHFGEARGCRGVSRGLETTRNDGKWVGARGYHSVSRGIETTRNDGGGGGRGWCGVSGRGRMARILKREILKQVQDDRDADKISTSEFRTTEILKQVQDDRDYRIKSVQASSG